MRLIKVEFNGYKRFQAASCNVDGHVIAFIGPNESGKSSLLRGLSWLTDDEDAEDLSLSEQNRRVRPDERTPVVRAHYRVDADDLVALRELDVDVSVPISDTSVTALRYSRLRDGSRTVGLETSITRNPKPFTAAAEALRRLVTSSKNAVDILAEHEVAVPSRLLDDTLEALDPGDLLWPRDRLASLIEQRDDMREVLGVVNNVSQRAAVLTKLKRDFARALDALDMAVKAGDLPEPLDSMIKLLSSRVPRFLLFGDDDRDLRERYNLADNRVRADPPAPLRNLLTVAGTSVAALWSVVVRGDIAVLRSTERRINETLRARIEPMWTQSKLTIDLTCNQDGVLEVNIMEIDSPEFTVTPIAERSDGLRAFLGLVCFLVAADLRIPPVLLIDEAERNLHYDAQADLVRVLTKELEVHKVLYTTHSPGCLPMDLGTGIRVVSRGAGDPSVSTLENNFWTASEPGFSHLLFAMGAEAAAFSAFKKALLAEGVSEMMLLPTLLRNATGGTQLDFQVAFGLSNMSAPRAMNTVALRTAFLVDGDDAGDTKKQQLLDAGVPRGHIFQLPKGNAIEDLVAASAYLNVVNGLLAETGHVIPLDALEDGVTIARAVDNYVSSHFGMSSGLSHKIIASRLAMMGEDLPLSAHGRRYLARLRRDLESAFQEPYTLTQSA